MSECRRCGSEDAAIHYCPDCGLRLEDGEEVRAGYHQDGHWDMSMSKLEDRRLSWVDKAVVETPEATIEIGPGSSIKVEGEIVDVRVEER